MAPPYAAALLLLLPLAAARRESFDFDANLDVALPPEECGREVAEPGGPLQKYFDMLRVNYGILQGAGHFLGEDGLQDPAKCTKKDVCLLMRQLDMDFYQRARIGKLQDMDYKVPPTQGWVTVGTCAGQEDVRGFKMKSVVDKEVCERAAKKRGLRFVGETKKVDTRPYGCFYYTEGKGEYVYFNPNEKSDVEAKILTFEGDHFSKQVKVVMEVLCEQDRSLTESGAAYYSPYKLKPSMVGNEGRSTSCSFGMMAFLAKLRETKSPCAKILAYEAHEKFKSAQDALDMASKLEGDGAAAGASKLREYVETLRQKYVLVDAIANTWCPGIWTASMKSAESGSTCGTPRLPQWTVESQKVAQFQSDGDKANEASLDSPRENGGGFTPRGNGGGFTPRASKRLGRLGAKLKQSTKIAFGTRLDTLKKGSKRRAGNQALLDSVDEILAAIQAEDDFSEALVAAEDPDSASPEQMDSRGKPVKIALTEQACANLDDESLEGLLNGKPQAPADFFASASAQGK